MTDHKLLDATADVLPVGLQPTPFGDVWRALQQVAADVWNVDPTVYRAGIAWLWYALRNPAALNGLRQLLVAALISEQAPLVKDTQTAAELAEYIRLWHGYTPTFPKLEALYGVFAADVEILPITAPEYAPAAPADTKLAFFVIIRGIDFSRPLMPDEAELIAIRATPLGARPRVVTELTEDLTVTAYPVCAGVPSVLIENDAVCEPAPEPTPTYEEITVYADVSTPKLCQNSITNNTAQNVNTSSLVALYTDEARTTRFEFDYSNEYEFGYYSSSTGEWVSRSIQSINDMPATTANPGDGETVTKAFLLLDTAVLWFVCNNSNTSYSYNNQHAGFYGSAKLRIRKKDQQYYAGYFHGYQAYNNVAASYRSSFYLYAVPGLGSEHIALRSDFGAYVSLLFVGYYNAAGVLVSSGYTNFAKYTSTDLRVIYLGQDDGILNVRTAIYRLTQPTYTGWLNQSHTDVSTNYGQNYVFYDENGEYAMGDPQYLYIPIGIFDDWGRSVGTTQSIINACSMGVSNTNYLYFTQSTGRSITFARIWYIKVPNS